MKMDVFKRLMKSSPSRQTPEPSSPETFDNLIELALRVIPLDGVTTAVRGGDILAFDLQMASHGWSGSLEFQVYDDEKMQGHEKDELFIPFQSSKLIELELDLCAALSDTTDSADMRKPMTLRAIVTKRSVSELVVDPVEVIILRHYRIEFGDVASVLWGQHHPCRLYAQTTMKAVLEKHRGAKITLNYDWEELNKVYPLLFFALDPTIGHASFYDFLMWWTDRFRGLFIWDPKKNSYSLLKSKTDGAEVYPIFRRDISDIALDLPEIPRYSQKILDSFTGSTIPAQVIGNNYAVDGIVRETLLRTALASDVKARGKLEDARMETLPPTELTVQFKRLPANLLFPGDIVKFQKEGQGWIEDSWVVGRESGFRVIEVHLAGAKADLTASRHRDDNGEFKMTMSVRMELKSDLTTPRLPAFVEPTYPVHVEGEILSSVDPGDEKATYQPKENDDGLFQYRVKVPLWQDDSGTATEIAVPHNPGRMPGQLFFPAYRGERVLLALTWHKGWIESFLDWRVDVRIRADTQGNHMLLGKTPKSRTSLVNYYENEGELRPVFQLARVHDDDMQRIAISEGNFLIEIKEDPKGLQLKVENVDKAKQD
jgi:hypothetical protein